MTPVEERIDHAEAKRVAEWVLSDPAAGPMPLNAWEREQLIARAYLALLTEHSAREELVGEVRAVIGLGQNVLDWTRTHNRAVSRVDIQAMLDRLNAIAKETPCQ